MSEDCFVMPRIGVIVKPTAKPTGCNFHDLEGYCRERLRVGRFLGMVRGQAIWEVFCTCGKVAPMSRRAVVNPRIKSCGCWARERLTKHGMKGAREYRIWLGIKGRCETQTNGNYGPYGGSGIGLYPEWSMSFGAFLRDVGHCPSNEHTIDRYPNRDGNYEPGNVRWATLRQQNTNKSSNHFVTIDGETLAVVEWSDRSGIKQSIIGDRLRRGWEPRLAVFTPVGSTRKRRNAHGQAKELF